MFKTMKNKLKNQDTGTAWSIETIKNIISLVVLKDLCDLNTLGDEAYISEIKLSIYVKFNREEEKSLTKIYLANILRE